MGFLMTLDWTLNDLNGQIQGHKFPMQYNGNVMHMECTIVPQWLEIGQTLSGGQI